MVSRKAIEGTGEEISQYASAHPKERFLLTVISGAAQPPAFNAAKWDKAMKIIASFKGKLPVLPPEALSTDALYD
jgi:hypothetical protein